MTNLQIPTTQWKNLLRHRADPSSSYSDLVTHIASNSGLDTKSDPPRQTPNMGLNKQWRVLSQGYSRTSEHKILYFRMEIYSS